MKLIVAWIVAFLTAHAPPSRPQFIPEAKETVAEAEARYESIATDLTEVVYDKSEPPLFGGKNGRARTISVLESIMLFESGFRRDVDLGVGKYAKGDGGRSWCPMQIQLGVAQANGKTQQRIVLHDDGGFHFAFDGTSGLGGEDLVRDRKNCIRAGLHIVRSSFAACSRMPMIHRLNSYTSGRCDAGHDASKTRMGKALLWYGAHVPDFTDADVFASLQPNPLAKVEAPLDKTYD